MVVNETSSTGGGFPHPSPHRHRTSTALQVFAFAGGPAAWSLQLVCNYAFASFVCYPRVAPLYSPWHGWNGVWGGMLGWNLLAMVVAAAALVAGYRIWRLTRDEVGDLSGEILSIGEGRSRFMGVVGMMTGLLFLGAIIFDVIGLAMVPICIG